MIAPAIRSRGDSDERDEPRDDDVEDALRRPGEPGGSGGRSSKSGSPCPGTYSPSLDEQLGRGRRELHLTPGGGRAARRRGPSPRRSRPRRRTSSSGRSRLEHCGEALERLRPPASARRCRRRRSRSRRGPRGAAARRSGERLALADQHQPAAHAEDAHQLERDRSVRRPQEPDRERRRHDRRRYQPRRREVVVRTDAEREHDQRDEHERPEHPAGSRPPLARRVQPCLEEHENGDRRQERQPLGRPRLPEERPVDRVAVDDRSEDERDVNAECEAGDVGEDRAPRRSAPAGGARQRARGRGHRCASDGRRPSRPRPPRWRAGVMAPRSALPDSTPEGRPPHRARRRSTRGAGRPPAHPPRRRRAWPAAAASPAA